MKNSLKNILILVGFAIIFSCDAYLDVQPDDKLLETQVYNNEAGIQNALNGIYAGLTNTNLYGGHLTMSTVEVLGQRFNISNSGHGFRYVNTYEYDQATVESRFSAIWSSMYEYILNLNVFIDGIDLYPQVISESKKDVLKGEAYALRAFMHFDLLRLFGPVYSINSNMESIPYSEIPSSDISSLLPASEVVSKILLDLEMAETLLVNDPIRTYGKIYISKNESFGLNDSDPLVDYTESDYYRYRNLRFNYYAVKALQARVNLYVGKTDAALDAAMVVINEAGENGNNWFPWIEDIDVIAAGENPDRVLSTEVIFGLQNRSLYTRHNSFYRPTLTDAAILAPFENRLEEIYENDINDIRFQSSWAVPEDASKTYKTFIKYKDVVDSSADFRYLQPLIRISEMYYIVAEVTGDYDYLNAVRSHRNLPEVSDNIQSEIRKEYEKEFYGEGQLFFYYKRLNISEINDGSAVSGTLDMNESSYVVPLPISETDFR